MADNKLQIKLDCDQVVWRTELPLFVVETCQKNGFGQSSHLIMTWYALRWLCAVFPKKRGFGYREIAQRAGCSPRSVGAYIQQLLSLGLVEVVGEEKVRNFPTNRRIYKINLRGLEQSSIDMASDVLAHWKVRLPATPISPEQQAFFDAHVANLPHGHAL